MTITTLSLPQTLMPDIPTSEKLLLLAQDIRRRRIQNGISYAELAEHLGIAFTTLQKWEKSNYLNCKLSMYLKILKFLESRNIDTEY